MVFNTHSPASRARHRKPRSRHEKAQQQLHDSNAGTDSHRRKVSERDRAWLREHAATGFKDPQAAAAKVGFLKPGIGYRLEARLSDLVESERIRLKMEEKMAGDEALTHIATIGRDNTDRKVQLAALRTILEVEGYLRSDRSAPTDRPALLKQVHSLVARLKGDPRARMRMRAVELEISSSPESSSGVGSESPQNEEIVDTTAVVVASEPPAEA